MLEILGPGMLTNLVHITSRTMVRISVVAQVLHSYLEATLGLGNILGLVLVLVLVGLGFGLNGVHMLSFEIHWDSSDASNPLGVPSASWNEPYHGSSTDDRSIEKPYVILVGAHGPSQKYSRPPADI